MALPFFTKRTVRCERCGLRHAFDASECPHCGQMGDAGVEVLKREHDEEMAGGAALGQKFALLTIVLAALLLLAWLSL